MLKINSISGGLLLCFLTLVIPTSNAVFKPGKVHDVENVRQNYKDKLNSQVIQQIHSFSKSVLFYKAYASYFDRSDVDLPGFKKYFLSLFEERSETAHNLTTIVNERGGFVFFQNVKLRQLCMALSRKLGRFPHVCFFVLNQSTNQKKAAVPKRHKRKPLKFSNSYKKTMTGKSEKPTTHTMPSALSALEDSLALERSTNSDLKSLMITAGQLNDPAMRVKLDEFLERQVDIILNLSNLVTRLNFYKDTENYALGEYILDSEVTY